METGPQSVIMMDSIITPEDHTMIKQFGIFAILLAVVCCCASESHAQIISSGFNNGFVGNGQVFRSAPFQGTQFPGSQATFYGTRRAGVRVGGGQGVRIGTPRWGVHFGTRLNRRW